MKESLSFSENQNAKDVISIIKKQYGDRIVGFLNNDGASNIPCISTGILSLDKIIGIGGFPKGRIIELYGPESGGKSLILQTFIASCQKKGYSCLYVDAEHSFEKNFAQKIGIDTNNILVAQPEYLEQALDLIYKFIKDGNVNVVGIDSIASLSPKKEMEGEFEDVTMGLMARTISQGLRKLSSLIHEKDAICIVINQLRDVIGKVWGPKETTPGGRALKFYASLRIRTSQGAKLKNKNSILGHSLRLKVEKNKVAPPFEEAEIDVFFKPNQYNIIGIDESNFLIDAMIEHDLLKLEGRTYFYNGEKIATKKEDMILFLSSNIEERNKIVSQLRDIFFVH